jgi:RNA polymerase sigma-70 factor (ECF subfamily)
MEWIRMPASSSPSNPPSLELLRRARDGDHDALDRLFRRYLPKLHRLAHHRIPTWARNAAETADLVQDTFLHTFRRLQSFEPRGNDALLGYLRRSLLNRIRNQFRYAARHPSPTEIDEAHVDDGASPLEQTIRHEERERYTTALQRLRPADRDAIVGRIELGYSYEQLALILGKPTAEAARLAVRRALLRLGDEMHRAE